MSTGWASKNESLISDDDPLGSGDQRKPTLTVKNGKGGRRKMNDVNKSSPKVEGYEKSPDKGNRKGNRMECTSIQKIATNIHFCVRWSCIITQGY